MPPLPSSRLAARLPFHYGWLVVAAGFVTAFACLGMGRFALGMLLPAMGQALPLTRSEMGWISTANFIGYLLAVSLGGQLVRRLGARRSVVLGLVLVGGSEMLVARADGFWGVLALYWITGFGSGAANVPVMGLISHWFGRSLRGRAAGFVVIGSGVAIVLSGALVPVINAAYGAEGWRVSWLVIGASVMVAALVDAVFLRNHPSELGLEPVGSSVQPPPTPVPCAAAPVPVAGVSKSRILAHLGALYACFGFTYSIYATFIVTALVRERGFPESTAGQFWAWIGFLSLFSGPGFGTLSDRVGRGRGMMLVYACQASAFALAAAPLPDGFLYPSMALFGLSLWAIPSIMAAAVGDYLGPEQAAASFGTITMAFAAGQIGGPALAGVMADMLGSFSASFAMAAVVAGAAILGSFLLPRPQRH